MSTNLKFISILLIMTLLLDACGLATVSVRSIGARAKWANADKQNNDDVLKVEVMDSELFANIGHGLSAYQDIKDSGVMIGEMSVDINKIKWTDDTGTIKKGVVECKIDNEKLLFEVTLYEHSGMLKLKHKYRRGYGYPAQVLLVASIPVDIAVTSVAIAATIIIAPVYMVYLMIESTED